MPIPNLQLLMLQCSICQCDIESDKAIIDVPQPEGSLAIALLGRKIVILNGKQVSKPVIKNGMYYPFADLPLTIVADDRDSFERITQTEEWTAVADPNAWLGGYTHHETDPGRHESGYFVFNVPKDGKYKVEVYLPEITMHPSDSVDYRIEAQGEPAGKGGAIIGVKKEDNAYIFTLNQQAMSGWVNLGTFTIKEGKFKVLAKNSTEIDGPYFIADAMRLVAVDK